METSTPLPVAAEQLPVLAAHDISHRYSFEGRHVDALSGVNLQIDQGQRWGIVGESGSGKSTLVRIMAALLRPSQGTVTFRDQPISHRPERQLADIRGRIQLVFQDPRSSLDPRMTVGRIITESLRSRRLRRAGAVPHDTEDRLTEVMSSVGLDPDLAKRFPHELSGGQRQRVAVARALAPNPEVLIADEPVSALDVAVRAHVLNLLSDLVVAHGLTLVLVSHDLAVVRQLCDHVAVLKDGRVVESGSMRQVYENPQDPYTASLLEAIPAWNVHQDGSELSSK